MQYIIEKLEGEARLDVSWQDGVIQDTSVEFFNYRGIEEILLQRPLLDSLVIAPRVCGVCNVAHLYASVLAIEDIYNQHEKITISQKAKSIRELTLKLEAIQNHIKWFYLTMLPKMYKLNDQPTKKIDFEALHIASIANKIIAIFAGQWPHSSYMLPGGVVSDSTSVDIATALSNLHQIKKFAKKIVGVDIDEFLQVGAISSILSYESDLASFIKIAKKLKLKHIGKGYGRYIILGNNYPLIISKHKAHPININDIQEYQNTTNSKAVVYKNDFYETSPLAREILRQSPLIHTLHKGYKDSFFVRSVARVVELIRYIKEVETLLISLDLSQPSLIKPKIAIEDIKGVGVGLVEASRGSLLHKIEAKNNTIQKYDIITPTQWNLGNSIDDTKSLLQEATKGLSDIEYAKLVLYSYDVCSVCTTQ